MTQQSWLLLFSFSPPFFFGISCLIFFSLAGHLIGFILVGRDFRKAFRILGLGERKGRWVMEQDFERSLHSAQVSEESCPWPLNRMTSQRVERTWMRTDGYWWFRGEWVNPLTKLNKSISYHNITMNGSGFAPLQIRPLQVRPVPIEYASLFNRVRPQYI